MYLNAYKNENISVNSIYNIFIYDLKKWDYDRLQRMTLIRVQWHKVMKMILLPGSGSVILSRLKIGLAPQKHDVISMPRQQYTNTKHIPIGSYHPVVSIMLRYMDQKCIRWKFVSPQVKIDKIFGVTYRTFLSNATTFRNDCDNKRSVRIKHIS